MNILVADGLDDDALTLLRKVHAVQTEELDAGRLLDAIPSFHALIVRGRTKVTKEVLGRGTNLKVVGRAGVGVDNIDVETATVRRIAVVNAPTASTMSVAELAIGHMISLLRHLPMADRSVKEGKWDKKGLEGRELHGKVLGLLGSGRIGGEVAKRAHAFGMEVIAFDPYLSLPTADGLGIRLVDKESLFRNADVLSVHAALTSETKGLVGREELALMKRTAVLVNCARGEIVQEGALAEALRSGTIAGAAIDVFEKEPPTGSPLLAAPHVVFSPHLGASTEEAQARAGAII
ncbi:MAG: phosphoglycerate dehydrogenase, partial [Methanobacteriota archaeon]